MATHRQRQRKLARAQFHSAQCKERNRSGRNFVRTYDKPLHERRSMLMDAVATHRSTVATLPETTGRRMELESMTRDALRGLAATHNIRGRSIMTKDALINAILAHS